MASGAVELALALHRVPSMRRALRERSVPHDVGELLTLVGGSPVALARTAALHGEEPATVLDAARFFVREVLLFPGADAYRVLGLDRSASDAAIKAHYRALQHWLHPDRRGNDAESTYATRINVAWSQLRSPDRRHAYDSAMAHGSASLPIGRGAGRVRVNAWRAQDQRPAQWRDVAIALSAVGLCLWLAWVASFEPAPRVATNAAARGRQPREALAGPEVAAPEVAPLEAAIDPKPAQPAGQRRSGQIPLPPGPIPVPTPVPSRPPSRGQARTADRQSPPPARPVPAVERRPLSPAAPRRVSPPVSTSAAVLAAAPLAAADLLIRVQAAQRLGDELFAYLAGSRRTPPPIWRNALALEAADGVRDALAESTTWRRRAVFSGAQWQIGEDTAQVRIRVATSRRAESATGDVEARLGWRGGRWWVEHVSLENLDNREALP